MGTDIFVKNSYKNLKSFIFFTKRTQIEKLRKDNDLRTKVSQLQLL